MFDFLYRNGNIVMNVQRDGEAEEFRGFRGQLHSAVHQFDACVQHLERKKKRKIKPNITYLS